jgi:hypothetical protein
MKTCKPPCCFGSAIVTIIHSQTSVIRELYILHYKGACYDRDYETIAQLHDHL